MLVLANSHPMSGEQANSAVSTLKSAFPGLAVNVVQRNQAKNMKKLIVVGCVDEDLYVASRNKGMLLCVQGVKASENIRKYAMMVHNGNMLHRLLNMMLEGTESPWYTFTKITRKCAGGPVHDYVVSLYNARTRWAPYTDEEKRVVHAWQNGLKGSGRVSQNALVTSLVAACLVGSLRDNELGLNEVQDWGFMPSSEHTSENTTLRAIKEWFRIVFNGRKSEDLFVRTNSRRRSHYGGPAEPRPGPATQFPSLQLGKRYRSGGIRGRVVCVIDDYLTIGASMEAARQLLLAAGAKRVVCIALGGFNRQKRRGEFAYTKGTPVTRLCLEFDDEDNVQVGTGGDGPDVGTVTEQRTCSGTTLAQCCVDSGIFSTRAQMPQRVDNAGVA